jgi:hypothetical protein
MTEPINIASSRLKVAGIIFIVLAIILVVLGILMIIWAEHEPGYGEIGDTLGTMLVGLGVLAAMGSCIVKGIAEIIRLLAIRN